MYPKKAGQLALAILILDLGMTTVFGQAASSLPHATDFVPTDGTNIPADLPHKLRLPVCNKTVLTPYRVVKKPELGSNMDKLNEATRINFNPNLIEASFYWDGKNTRAEYEWEGGKKLRAYQIGSLNFWQASTRSPDSISYSQVPSALDITGQPRPGDPGAFPGLNWYSPSLFIGAAKVSGREVYVFSSGELKQGTSTPTDSAAPPIKTVLYLDVPSLLPVMFVDQNVTYVVKYLSKSAETVLIDDAFRKKLPPPFNSDPHL